ncbi:hypothetical protein NH340_JMT08647 [Sarcoptes scabiei]|nr:hypothetical protein NH340_JMT08647 [Sarcoptes scabiei]
MANISQAANERSLRSVFVGNIPYDASEEKLKDIFSEVGPVLSFKLVFDRESGKPKGYGFCEYRDQETAMSAMRNLNSYELNGRNLRVDTATNEKFKEEMRNLQMSLSGSTFESPYGTDIESDKAPEQIAKAVSSLPPEQMFEIAKQMKNCVLTNPNEARNMLIQNPQLSYALLQLLVVMRAIDINTASSILYKPNPPPSQIPIGGPNTPLMPPSNMIMPNQHPQPVPVPSMPQMHQNLFDPHDQFNRVPPQAAPQQHPQNFDQRHLDPRLRQNEVRSQEMYDPRLTSGQAASAAPVDPRLRAQPMDPRHLPPQANVGQPIRGPANSVGPSGVPPPLGPRMPNQPMFGQPNFAGQPVQPTTSNPNPIPASNASISTPSLPGQPPTSSQQPLQQQQQAAQQPQAGLNQTEAEKAQLIMQVLSLSDQQINMLPADQRQSILMLRQQLQQSNN